MRLRWLAVIAVICGLLGQWGLAPTLSHAQSDEGEQRSSSGVPPRYRQLIRKALDEYGLGNWAEAKVYFREAHAIWANARTFRGLGMTCYESRNYVEAISMLEQALANKEQPLTPKMAEEARAIVEQARHFVSVLELTPPQATVVINGKKAERNSSGEIVLDPGVHQLQAQADGYETLYTSVTADGGNRLYLRMSQERSAAAAAVPESRSVDLARPREDDKPTDAPPPEAAGYTEQNPVIGAILAPIGVAGLATGWVFYSLRQGIRRQLPYIDENGVEVPTLLSDVANVKTYGIISLAAAGGGALILSLSEFFWLPDHPSVPAWAWVLGGVGTAIAGAGLAFSLLGTHCEMGDTASACQSVVADAVFGPLLAIHGLPFLALPLNYAIRVWTRPAGIEVSLIPGGVHGPSLTLMGRF
ncbi:MAG: tetratricopeptide repeat protein [Polyangiales bacterium]